MSENYPTKPETEPVPQTTKTEEGKINESSGSANSNQKDPTKLIEEAQELLTKKHSPLYSYLKGLSHEESAKLDLNQDGAIDRDELSKSKSSDKSAAIKEVLVNDGGLYFDISRMSKNDGVGISRKDIDELGARELDQLMLKQGVTSLLKHLARADEQSVDEDGNLVKRDGKLSKEEIKELLEWSDIGKEERAAIIVAVNHFERQARLSGRDPNKLLITEDALKKAIEYEPKLPSLSLEGLKRTGDTIDRSAEAKERTLEEAIALYSGRTVGNWLETSEHGEIPAMLETIVGIKDQKQADRIINDIESLVKKIKTEEYPTDKKGREQLINRLNEQKGQCADWQKLKEQINNVLGVHLCAPYNSYDHSRLVSREEFARLAFLPGLRSIDLNDTKFSEDQLASLPKLPNLKSLIMYNQDIGDAGIAHIVNTCPNINTLAIELSRVTDGGLHDVAKLKRLTKLALAETKITDSGIEALADLPLEHLAFYNMNFEGSNLHSLAKLKTVTDLALKRSSFQHIPDLPPGLLHLSLEGTKIEDGLQDFPKLDKLRGLDLRTTNFSDAELSKLPELPSLKWLGLVSSNFKSPEDAQLFKHRQLQELNLEGSKITDAQIPELSKLQSLTNLDLSYTPITDKGLLNFPVLPKLGVLNLQISTEGNQLISDKAISTLTSKLNQVNPDFKLMRGLINN